MRTVSTSTNRKMACIAATALASVLGVQGPSTSPSRSYAAELSPPAVCGGDTLDGENNSASPPPSSAVQSTSAAYAASNPGDCGTVGCNCSIQRVCVAYGCLEWGAPPSDPYTVKCLKQGCVEWEDKFICR